MFNIFKLVVLVMFLISPLYTLNLDSERENKWKISSWITPLKIGLIGGLLYGSAKHIRPVFVFADSGNTLPPGILNEGYDVLPYPMTLQSLNAPENLINQKPFMGQRNCLYGTANGCREFYGQGWALPGYIRQERIPGRLNTPLSQKGVHDTGINFIPTNTAYPTNTRNPNVNFRPNVQNFSPNGHGSTRKTETGINFDRNNFNPIPSTTGNIPNTSYINTDGQNLSTVVSFRNVERQDPRRYTTSAIFSTDSLETTPKPS